jgi:F-type H+-transporting ATPase subunit b
MASPAEEAVKSSGLPQFDFNTWPSQVIWLVIAFAILYVVLDRFLLPRLGQVMEERAERIADNLDAAARMKAEAEDAERLYEKALADARAKSSAIAAEARVKADRLIADETAKAESEAAKAVAEAEVRIHAMTAEAMASANDVATEAASAMLARLAGLKPTAATLTKAIMAASQGKA